MPDLTETTTIDIAGHSVPVVKGGLYDLSLQSAVVGDCRRSPGR
jgi:hypothetical protein